MMQRIYRCLTVEGILVDEDVTFANLKDLIYNILSSLFGENAGKVQAFIFSIYRTISRS